MSSPHIVGEGDAVRSRSLQGSPGGERRSRRACKTRPRPGGTGALCQTERLAQGTLISCVRVWDFCPP